MSSIELILKDIEDPHVRENFNRIQNLVNKEIFFQGNFYFFQIELTTAVSEFQFRHGLKFIPKDIIVLHIDGNKQIDFRYDLFTREYLVLSSEGPAKIRLLAGSYIDIKNFSNEEYLQVPVIGLPPIPGAIGEISKVMACAASVSTGDWVVQSLTIDDTAEVLSDNLGSNPIIGIVKDKPTAITCTVIYYGFFPLAIGRGRIYLNTAGAATITAPSTGNIQHLGISFGNGTILVKPESIVLRRV